MQGKLRRWVGFRFGMVKLQRDFRQVGDCGSERFPLWHGKVATLSAAIYLQEHARFRFGMVKLQRFPDRNPRYRRFQFPLWHGKVATLGLTSSVPVPKH